MESNDRKIFELDEPAAKSHTPPGWPIRIIEIELSVNAPKNYGFVECLVILHDCVLAMMIDLAMGSLSRRVQCLL
jgi:hypothetical protein